MSVLLQHVPRQNGHGSTVEGGAGRLAVGSVTTDNSQWIRRGWIQQVRELFVVTHPESTHHVEHRVGGWFDSELTERGRCQAQRIAAALRDRVDTGVMLFASDLRRTAETAEILAGELRCQWCLLSELREKSYGEAEGRPDAWLRERFVPPPPDGDRLEHDEGLLGAETVGQWGRRVYAGMDIVLHDAAKQTIVVTHGGTASLVVAHWIGMPVTSLGRVRFRVTPGSITHLREDDYFHNRSLESLNETAHLGH